MTNKPIIIHQTLHGYSNGHHLLASSTILSDATKRKMDILSDLSGPDLSKGFESYYSGYFLENEQFLVLAKTWYANEMSRPGCVWTHSLLLGLNDIEYLIYQIPNLLSYFVRPDSQDSFVYYSRPLETEVVIHSQDQFDQKKIQYLLWTMLGHEPPNIVYSHNSVEYIKEVIYVWLMCYNELPPEYSFITGSMSIRCDNAKIISLQFVPNELRNKVYRSDDGISTMKNINEVQKFPPWVTFTYDIIQNNGWHSFVMFRKLFGTAYNKYKYLTLFIKLYSVFRGDNGCLNIFESLELIEKVFSTDKIYVGNKFIDLYFEGAFSLWGTDISYTNTIIATLKFTWLSISDDMLNALIGKGFVKDQIGAKKVVQYLTKVEDNQIQERYLFSYAHLLTADLLEKFSDMDYSICSVLVTINPSLAECVAIWKQSRGYQKGILDSLRICENDNRLNINLIYTILDNSIYDFASEIYALWGEASIDIFLEYLLQIRFLLHEDTQTMLELCKAHSKTATLMFEKQFTSLSSKQICTLLSIINPYSDRIANQPLVNMFKMLNIKDLSSNQKDDLADFYLPIILRSSQYFPDDLVAFVAYNVHDRLANLVYPENKWRKLQSLLPETSWLNQWDKCKRVRKAIKKKGYNIKKLEEYNDNDFDIHLL
ncbi:hypothetical protein SAMN02745823_02442 [Sporobacter termitidis DSM 10068]|uniref:Uncharacterized protein n=1 Tax=Sporobacter termitidis DSM 10068 TaxID=1123282 RepID=A0A1M5YEI7_9FIRM|nr:hypothetical protein [Sporobacter termitidis]SHI10396.1 hypothetical protein SAMN02745823_02442 [Sporobacter termitidis DSM 10068]